MNNRGRRIFTTTLIVLVLLVFTDVMRADVTGTIRGMVRDHSGAAIAGAKLTASNALTNFKVETISGADGTFRFLALPVGTYKLAATATGFRPSAVNDITVKVNDELQIDLTLEVGTVSEEVEVVANSVQVQTESTQLGDVIDSKKMLALPLNGRSYIDLLGLQAGVAPVRFPEP
jgi:hypothetical protein